MWTSRLHAFAMLHSVMCSIGTKTVVESKLVVHTTFHYGDAELRIFNLCCWLHLLPQIVSWRFFFSPTKHKGNAADSWVLCYSLCLYLIFIQRNFKNLLKWVLRFLHLRETLLIAKANQRISVPRTWNKSKIIRVRNWSEPTDQRKDSK